jgi:UDP-N-acetylglucosamine--N-acetylmuramyl-(pentapeptide) pyrophosphoryl-undecaprenol N-acetylglucosamine transferase
MRNVKVVVVGGHHTPALAVIDALMSNIQHPTSNIRWIGHRFSMWGDKNVSAEYQEVTGRGIPFYDLKAGKIYKTFHPLKLIRLPFGFLQAFYYLVKIRPQLIASFGGYLAPPVVIAGWLLGIPSVTHEQTVVGGWANRLVAKFAKKVFVTWEESLKYFPREKTIVTGNPLRRAVLDQIRNSKFESPRPTSPASELAGGRANKFQIPNSKLQTIYITGGKQGSHIINEAVKEALPELLKKYNVIHQCGRSTVFDDYQTLTSHTSHLTPHLRSRYILKDYFSEEEIGGIFEVSDVVISRAGANIVYELAALGKPAILIPIPWASHNEQMKSAKILTDVGAAVILEEKNLSAESISLHSSILFADLEKYREGGRRAQKLVRPDAANRIAEDILSTLRVAIPQPRR